MSEKEQGLSALLVASDILSTYTTETLTPVAAHEFLQN